MSKPPAPEAFLTTEEVLGGTETREGRRRLLLVDDDEGTRILLSTMLKKEYDVDTVIDGSGALDALRRAGASSDRMISDLNMPGMDGIALIRVNLRVAGYLTKPLRDSQVLQAAARALGAPAA